MNPLAQEALASILRSLLKIAAGYLVARGIWTDEQAASYIAPAALALIGMGWSVWKTYTSRRKLVTALAMPSGSSENEVKALIANANVVTPSVSQPKDVAPAALIILNP